MRYKLFLFHADMFSTAIMHVLQEGRDKNGWSNTCFLSLPLPLLRNWPNSSGP